MKDVLRMRTMRLLHEIMEPFLARRGARRTTTFVRGLSGRHATTEEKTKSFWDKEAGTWEVGKGIHWTEHIAIHERLNRKMSGDTYIDLYLYVINFLKERGLELPLQRCLTLGCGAGDFERTLSKYHFCMRHDAYDISEGAIEKAKERAGAERLSHIFYEVADINSISLLAGTYDVVFGIHSVHHFSALEHVFSEVRKSLKSGGFFVFQEYVGPNKFQWTEKQLSIINGILAFLPDKYCRSRKDGITLKKRQWRPTIEEMDSVDPSEAVRSEEILKVLPVYFDVLEKRDLGGSILHLLLDGIAGNFDYDNPKDMRLLEMIFEIEDTFMEIGEIQSDFAFVIARKT
jgi:SAM-dependent methyltransferase